MRKKNLHMVANNARFLIQPWVRSKNLESRILSLASRRIVTIDKQGTTIARYCWKPLSESKCVKGLPQGGELA
jgi:hypothetical protein